MAVLRPRPAAAWANASAMRGEGIAVGHQARGADPGQERQHPAEGRAAAVGAGQCQLAEVEVEQVDGQRASLRADADQLHDPAGAHEPGRRRQELGLPDRLAGEVDAPARGRALHHLGEVLDGRVHREVGAESRGGVAAARDRIRQDGRPAPRAFARARVRSPMMPPPITTTVAPRRILAISSPSRQQAAGSARAAVARSSPSGGAGARSAGEARPAPRSRRPGRPGRTG